MVDLKTQRGVRFIVHVLGMGDFEFEDGDLIPQLQSSGSFTAEVIHNTAKDGRVYANIDLSDEALMITR